MTWRDKLGRYDILLAGLAAACTGAFAWSRPSVEGWLCPAFVGLAALFPLGTIPARWRERIERGAWILFAVTLAWVLWWLLSIDGQGQPSPPIPLLPALAAPVLTVVFLAGRRNVWDPDRTLLPACLVVVVLAVSRSGAERLMLVPIIVVLCAGAALLIGRDPPFPGGRQRLVRLVLSVLGGAAVAAGVSIALRRAQPWVLQLASRAAFPEAQSGFNPETQLGGVQRLELSDRVILRVWTERPGKLRASVGTRFDGRTWTPLQGPGRVVLPALAEGEAFSWSPPSVEGSTFVVSESGRTASQGTDSNTYIVRAVESVPGSIPAPPNASAVRIIAARLNLDSLGLLHPALEAGTAYAVREGRVATASASNDADLAVPEDTDPRLRDLAASLAAGEDTEAGRVQATVEWLQANIRYSLEVGQFASRQPVAEFLFEKRQGWCEYFATAAAVLLRLEGVPTRFVKGFNVRHRRGGRYVVREADAHAWIDAWLPGQGWVEVDPTPPGQYDQAHGEPGLLDSSYERLLGLLDVLHSVQWSALVERTRSTAVALLGRHPGSVAGISFFVVGMGLIWLRRKKVSPGGPQGAGVQSKTGSLLSQLDRLWIARGLARAPAQGPLEHLKGIPSGAVPLATLQIAQRIVDLYYRERFAGKPVAADEVKRLQVALDACS